MKYFFIPLCLSIFFSSCKKNTDTTTTPIPPVQPEAFSDKIILYNLQPYSDSISLTWSILNNPKFKQYTVLRKEKPTGPWSALVTITDSLINKYVDKNTPYTTYLEYQIIGNLTTSSTYISNTKIYDRPEIKTVYVSPFHILFDKQNRWLYFFEKSGTIQLYNLSTNQVDKSINTASTIGYCDFGLYNGTKELYVPRNDGWIFIYNAQSLDKIDQINVGLSSSCVIAINGLLYVSTSAFSNLPIRIFNRATKSLILQTGNRDLARFKKVPNTNADLLEVSLNVSPVDQQYYSFDLNGNLLSHQFDTYHGDYPLDGRLVEFFPSGLKYISSSYGSIYNKGMVYEGSLPRGNLEFTTFEFDIASQLIYGGTKTKTVEVYSQTNYIHNRSIQTKAYPYKLFEDGTNGFICISSVKPFFLGDPEKIVIEKVQ